MDTTPALNPHVAVLLSGTPAARSAASAASAIPEDKQCTFHAGG